MVKPCNFRLCQQCNSRDANAIAGVLCVVCFRQNQLKELPLPQIEREVRLVVPKRFAPARMKDLKSSLQALYPNDIETGVFLWGTTGVGKSYAMAAAARKYILAGFIVRRIGDELLCLKLRDTFKPGSRDTEWEVIQPLISCDMLFLEDVGAIKRMGREETDFSVRTLQVLIDTRLEQCLPTFITSNKSLENLAKSFDERIGSRLKVFKIGKLAGEDRRERDA